MVLAGGQSAGPGLPVSVSPPGADHRVGTQHPSSCHGAHLCLDRGILLPASCTLFWEQWLLPAPLHSPGTSLLCVVQEQGGPYSQMLMVVNVEWGNSRSLKEAVGAGFVARFEC